MLNEQANRLAKETGFIKRVRKVNGADVAQSLIFGWLQEPDISLSGLCQVLGRREVEISASGLHQRFTPESAAFLRRIFDDLSSRKIQAEEAVPTKLLQPFEGALLEDSSVIGLPRELSDIWHGCGGHPGASTAGVKLFVRWDVLAGRLEGPRLTDARTSDRRGSFEGEPIPPGSLYLADLGFFGLEHCARLMQRQGRRKGYVITRLLTRTALLLRKGHRVELRGILPMRLILVRVPKAVGDQRRQQMIEDGHDHGRVPTEETLYLADWTILLTNCQCQ